MFYAGPAGNGELAGAVRNRNGRHAIHRGVLDCALRHPGRTGDSGVCGERQRHEEFAGTQDGYPGMSMVVEIACLRNAAKFVPAGRGDLGDADVLAAAAATYWGCVALYSAY